MPKMLIGPMLSSGRAKLIAEAVKLVSPAGARFAYLVPTPQLQKEVEGALMQTLASENDQSAFPGLGVYLCDGFVNELLKDALCYQLPVPSYQQKLILKDLTSQLQREGRLNCLLPLVEREGFYTSILEWLLEVKRSRISVEEWFARFAHTAREQELGLIYQAYERFLTVANLSDTERNYTIILEHLTAGRGQTENANLPNSTYLSDSTGLPGSSARLHNASLIGNFLPEIDLIIVDGFYKLNQLQIQLLGALLDLGKDVIVHISLESERKELFLSAREMVTHLEKLACTKDWQWEREELAEIEVGQRPEVLAHLCKNLFNINAQQVPGSSALEVLHAPDPYREIEAIGRQVKKTLLNDTECKLDQIAIILRNTESYHFYIEEIFGELGIPYDFSRGTELWDTPIYKLILKIHSIFLENWSRESVVELLKSQYLSIAPVKMAEKYEELILEAGIIEGKIEWVRKLGRLHTHLQRELERQLNPQNSNAKDTETQRQNISSAQDAGTQRSNQSSAQDAGTQRPKKSSAHDDDTHQPKNSQIEALQVKIDCLLHLRATLEGLFGKLSQLEKQVAATTNPHILRRDLKSLSLLSQLLEEMVKLGQLLRAHGTGEWPLSVQEFLQCLNTGAREMVIPEPRARLDAVKILTPSQSRGCEFKYVYIGGLLEGQFPWYGFRDWLFKADERQNLQAQGIYFKQFYERMEEERLFFLEAVRTARDKLVLTCPGLAGDDRVQISSFIDEVRNLFTENTIAQIELVDGGLTGDRIDLTEVLTRRELDEILLRELFLSMLPTGAETEDAASGLAESAIVEREISAAIREIATALEEGISVTLLSNEMLHLVDMYGRGKMNALRQSTTFSAYDGTLENPDIARELAKTYHSGRVYSISQINDYAVCPFQFFAKRILDLDAIEEPILRLEPLDLGNLYHEILFRFWKGFAGWQNESEPMAVERLREIAREVMADNPAGLSLPQGLWMVYQEEILENLERILSFEYQEAARQDFQLTPTYFEASFGLYREFQEEGTLNHPEPVVIRRTLRTATGENPGEAAADSDDKLQEITVKFSGKIDRIDLSNDGKYLVIYDYKLGQRKGYEEMDAGIDLQLPVYVKAARLFSGAEKEVLGAGYFALLKCDRKAGVWRGLAETLIPVTKRSSSCHDEESWQAFLDKMDDYIIDYVQRIKAGDFRVNPTKCPRYCKFKTICRFDPARIRRKLKAEEKGVDSDGI